MSARCYPFKMLGHCFHNIDPQVCSHSLSHIETRDILIIIKLYDMDIHDLSFFRGCCAHCPPISVRGGGILRCSPRPVLGGQASAVFLLSSAAQGSTAADSVPRRADYTYDPDDIQVQLVFYSTFEPMVLPGRPYGS